MVVPDKDFSNQKHLFDGKINYQEDFGKMTMNIPATLKSFGAIWDYTNQPNEFDQTICKCFIKSIQLQKEKSTKSNEEHKCVLVIGMPLKLTE